jgi:glycosyltransferase involved in cell wall biosynthesis
MLTFVVMPCLNEADMIEQTVSSLGFSAGNVAPADTHLVVVDNGSTDSTPGILKQMRRSSPARLHLFTEAQRGYVPPRRRGVVAAEAMAGRMGVSPDSVLILQADADTIYKPGYVQAMQMAANAQIGIMLEGATRQPPGFEAAHPTYVAAERIVDDRIEQFDAADEDEVVVDDKVCGYRLSDYLSWGGLFDEVTVTGDHIHAETTRMFIRAKLTHGARKVRVNPAGAASSRRKIYDNPWLHYATVGFPREAAWVDAQSKNMSPGRRQVAIDAFAERVLRGGNRDAIYLRRGHQLALFRYLPALIACVLNPATASELPEDVAKVLAALEPRSREDLARAPGLALIELLQLIDTHPMLFQADSERRAAIKR